MNQKHAQLVHQKKKNHGFKYWSILSISVNIGADIADTADITDNDDIDNKNYRADCQQ